MHGAMTVLLKDALAPNLSRRSRTIRHSYTAARSRTSRTAATSVIATQTALKLADYVVTEAGFGADLGAEKFIDIKRRKAQLATRAVVIVATLRAQAPRRRGQGRLQQGELRRWKKASPISSGT